LTLRYARLNTIRRVKLWTDYDYDSEDENPNYFIKNIVNGEIEEDNSMILSSGLARITLKSYFVKYAQLTYHIKNVNCFDETDTLWLEEIYVPMNDTTVLYGYYLGMSNNSGGRFNSPDLSKGTGCIDEIRYTDTNPIYRRKPAGEYVYRIKAKRNGVVTESSFTKILKGEEMNFVEIFY
jgi:hypothetical protein